MTIVFIPGTLCTKHLFHSQIEALSEYSCVVVNHSVSDDLSKVSKYIFEKINGPMIVVGLSYGGIIAMEMMRQNAERINGLVLMNTNHRLPSETTRTNQERFVGMAVLGSIESLTEDILIEAMLHPDHAHLEKTRRDVLLMTKNTRVEDFINQIKSQLGRPDSRKDMLRYNCPVLLITGREDKVCTPAVHEDMHQLIPDSELKIIENCGHLSTLEKPKEVNGVLLNWLTKNFN